MVESIKESVKIMAFENFDHVLYMQIRVANLYRRAHNMSVCDFLKLDRDTDFFSFVEDAYETFMC